MRLLFNILAGISTFLLLLNFFFWTRSYWRYEGMLHYGKGQPMTVRAANQARRVEELQPDTHSAGWVSVRGQLTYLSIANPIPSNDWETWSLPVDVEASTASWSSRMAAEAAGKEGGLRMGSRQTQADLWDQSLGLNWQLPYWFFTIPYWMLTIVFAILPYRWAVDYWRKRKQKKAE